MGSSSCDHGDSLVQPCWKPSSMSFVFTEAGKWKLKEEGKRAIKSCSVCLSLMRGADLGSGLEALYNIFHVQGENKAPLPVAPGGLV